MMITKTSRLNVSNNESLENISMASNCDREVSVNNSSEPSNEEPPAGTFENKSVILDSNYIETKIKSLLHQEDDNGIESSTANNEKLEEAEAGNVTALTVEQPERITGILTAEDSCNAVDHKISSGEGETSQLDVAPEELSFNGKIRSLNDPSTSSSQCDLTDATKSFEKVRQDKLNESYEMLTKENSSLMHYNNEKSPDLFADDDDDEDDDEAANDSCHDDARSNNGDVTDSENVLANNSTNVCMDPVEQIERKLLKKLQASLSGVLPPPSVTRLNIDVNRMLSLYQQNEERFSYRNEEIVEKPADVEEESIVSSPVFLSKPTHPPWELNELRWPQLLKARAHGVYYNHSTVTEKIELLGLKYVERYIHKETSTSFDMSQAPSSAKKKNSRLKLLNKSPGSRLSHLARRRATFSSANLLNTSVGSSSSGSSLTGSQRRLCNRQIVLDAKKSDNRRKNKGRTPKRRTPGRRKTPGSSAKKRTLSLAAAKPTQTLSREAPKRALFQSPPDEPAPKANHVSPAVSRTASSKTQKLKRVLFSPPVKRRLALAPSNSARTGGSSNTVTNASDSSGIKNLSTGESVDLDSGEPSRKRKRPIDEAADDDDLSKKQKMSRTEPVKEEDLTPRSLKFPRSQSFCLGSGSKNSKSALDSSRSGRTLVRANSESVTLTENHRKKLLWAVSQALQTKQITMKHENFRKYASILAHVVKKLFLEFNDHSVSSTSEKMLRLAHKHLFDVLQGQTSEEIYQRERTRLLNARNILKPHGYISPEEYERCKLQRSRSASVFVLDNSNDSSFGAGCSSQPPPPVPLSQCSSVFSQSSEFLNGLSQSSSFHGSQPAAGGDSAKNTILRENIDSEQRQKSSQKQNICFSGKDQKNVSPYADAKSGSQAKTKLLVGGGSVGSSILKAKRQISFE